MKQSGKKPPAPTNFQVPVEGKLYTTPQAAKYLKVTTAHIRKRVGSGRLIPLGKGRQYIFTKTELDRYKSELRAAGRPMTGNNPPQKKPAGRGKESRSK